MITEIQSDVFNAFAFFMFVIFSYFVVVCFFAFWDELIISLYDIGCIRY